MARLLLRVLVVVLALACAATFTAAAVEAIRGKVAADPIEQSIVDQAKRFAAHQWAYGEPTRPGAPVLMPGFPALVAGLVGVDVPRLELVRAVALTATLFTAFLLLFLVHFETASWTLGLAALGLFLFGQGLFATVPGVARPESLALLASLLAFGALRYFVGVAGSILAGVLLAFAWFVDAGALVFLLGALVSQALDERRRLATLAVVSGVLIAAATVVLMPRLGPWLSAAAWSGALERFTFDPRAAVVFTTTTLLGRLGLFAAAFVFSCALTTQPWRDREGLWIWLGVSAVAGGAFATQQGGGPIHAGALAASIAAFALLGTLALQRVVHQLASRVGDDPSGEAVMMAALVLQFGVFAACAADAAWVRGLSLAV